MDLGLANATAVVVGGSGGMGLVAARRLAEDGAWAALVGRSKTKLGSVVTDLTARGGADVLGLVADIRDAAQLDKVFADVGERWDGELNGLINTVGAGAPGSFGLGRRVPCAAARLLHDRGYMTGANIDVDGGSDFT
jgi:3-oxoacyl-[acyl-carrier protein] reductase